MNSSFPLSGYSLNMNPKRIAIQPNKLIHSIYPTRHGQLLSPKPTFFYLQEDDKSDNDPEYPGLRNTPDSSGKLIASPNNENIFITHYSGQQPFSGPIEKLSVILIGNEEVPDVSMYASTVKILEFTGHLSFTGPVFSIIQQLPAVTKVKFFIGRSQLPIFREVADFDCDISYSFTTVCPNVESLEIVMDLECYYENPWFCSLTCSNCSNHCWDMVKTSFDSLVESLLNRSKQGFPNLKNLYTDLPDSDIYYGGITSLIEVSKFLVEKTWVKAIEGPIPDELNKKKEGDKLKSSVSAIAGGDRSWVSLTDAVEFPDLPKPSHSSIQETEGISSQPSCYYTISE